MGVKVCTRRDKPGWWVVVHHQGRRKKKYFGKNRKLAQDFAEKLEAKLKLGSAGIPTKAGVKIEEYAETWLERIGHTRKHTTHEDYQKMLRRDILPVLRGLDLEDVTREKVRTLAFDGLKRGQSPKTVQNVLRCLSSLLSHAVEDGLLTVNTALKPGKFLPKVSKRRGINALTREEVATFLDAVRERAPRYYPLFLCAVRTGLRMGELLALQWGDLDFHGRFIEVQRNYTHWKVTTPKSGEQSNRHRHHLHLIDFGVVFAPELACEIKILPPAIECFVPPSPAQKNQRKVRLETRFLSMQFSLQPPHFIRLDKTLTGFELVPLDPDHGIEPIVQPPVNRTVIHAPELREALVGLGWVFHPNSLMPLDHVNALQC